MVVLSADPALAPHDYLVTVLWTPIAMLRKMASSPPFHHISVNGHCRIKYLLDSPQVDLLLVCRFLVCTSLDYSDPPVFRTCVCIQGLQIAGTGRLT